MYKVMWWNAIGETCCSASMDEATALVFLASMLPEQEARLVYVSK
jgi:hypothetical protein